MSLFLSSSRLLWNPTFMLPESFIVHNLYTRTIIQTDQGVLYAIYAIKLVLPMSLISPKGMMSLPSELSK